MINRENTKKTKYLETTNFTNLHESISLINYLKILLFPLKTIQSYKYIDILIDAINQLSWIRKRRGLLPLAL